MQTNLFFKNRTGHFLLLVCLSFIPVHLNSQTIEERPNKSILFIEADQAKEDAHKELAYLLAPKAFEKAMESLKKAENDYIKNRKIGTVRKQLFMAVSEFNKAIRSARIAFVTFEPTVQARFDALKAEAPIYVKSQWDQAELKMKKAARTLEDGYKNQAENTAMEAEIMYRSVELKSIKENVLGEAYERLRLAESLNAGLYAPRTLKKAQDLVKEAERKLIENKQDTDEARVLARQARREARRVLYLYTRIKLIRESTLSYEDVLLAAEAPILKIAKFLDIPLDFEQGIGKIAEKINGRIVRDQNDIQELRGALYDEKRTAALLMQRNEELGSRLGSVERDKSFLIQIMEDHEKTKEMYAEIQILFTPDEALLFREGSAMRIRLTGLAFPSGKSNIDPQYHRFLNKIIQAIQRFPNADIIIEGHTDSYGSDRQNFQLSFDRAENVMLYIQENINIDKSKIQAIGFGETRPIATNETEEGRVKNRRIAVVIYPNLGDGY